MIPCPAALASPQTSIIVSEREQLIDSFPATWKRPASFQRRQYQFYAAVISTCINKQEKFILDATPLLDVRSGVALCS